jgi:hypothetical protein
MVSFTTDYSIVGRLVKDSDQSVAEASFIPIGRSALRLVGVFDDLPYSLNQFKNSIYWTVS